MDRRRLEELQRLMSIAGSDPDSTTRRRALARAAEAVGELRAESPGGRDVLDYRGGPRPPHQPSSMIQLAQVHPPILGNYVQAAVPPTRILTVPAVPSVAPGDTSDQAKLDFSAAGGCDNGFIIGMRGTVRDDTAGVQSAGSYEYASIELELSFNDGEFLITNGEQASFAPYSDLFAPEDREPFPLYRHVSSTDSMFFRWRNTQPAATGNTLTPTLSFLFVRTPYPGS